jgi:hypothetical protein
MQDLSTSVRRRFIISFIQHPSAFSQSLKPGLLSIMVQMTFGHSARMAILRCTFLAVAAKAVVLRFFIGTRFGLTLPDWT